MTEKTSNGKVNVLFSTKMKARIGPNCKLLCFCNEKTMIETVHKGYKLNFLYRWDNSSTKELYLCESKHTRETSICHAIFLF